MLGNYPSDVRNAAVSTHSPRWVNLGRVEAKTLGEYRSYGLLYVPLETAPAHMLHPDGNTRQQIDMFAREEECPLVDAFQGIEPDKLTPRQALELLYTLKDMAGDRSQ